jgi:hypothetical protein
LVLRLPLQIIPGFTLPTSLLDLAAMAVRILMSGPQRPTSARADIGAEHAHIAKRMAIKAPIAHVTHCPLAFAGAHLPSNRSGYPRTAYHFCKSLDEQLSQCILYDGPGPNARLIGVEYLVSDEVYRQMPAEEQLYWHDHTYEVDAGLLSSPAQSRSEARATLAQVRTLWGKVYYTWPSGSDYPRGPSRLSWSDTGELPFVLPPGAEAQLSIR